MLHDWDLDFNMMKDDFNSIIYSASRDDPDPTPHNHIKEIQRNLRICMWLLAANWIMLLVLLWR
jgi:hypothetical protein